MSTANVELVRAILPAERDLVEVFASDDPVGAFIGDARISVADIEVEFAGSQSGAPGQHYRGLDGLLEGWRDWLTPWESYKIEVEELIDAGDEVVMLVNVQARTSRDGVALEHKPAAVWTVRDGTIVRVKFYLRPEQALESVEGRRAGG
jgi:ketosteroid isomerase-like protein